MSEKIFQWMLRLYPRRFRSEYGDAMRQLFRDRLGTETSILGRFRLWMNLLQDFVMSVRREHRRRAQVAAAESGNYRISEEAFAEMERSHIRERSVEFLSIALGFLIAWLGHAQRWPLWAVYSLLTFLMIASFRGVGRLEDHWRSYELILGDDRIQQSENGVVTLTLLKIEITRLLEMRDLGFAVQTQDPRKCILVPSALNGYEELGARLKSWLPVEKPPEEPTGAYFMIPYWIVAMYPAALLVRSPYFAIPLAVLVGVYLLYLLHVTRGIFALRTLPDGTIWKSFLAASLPLVLIALLIVKLVLVLR
jgi:hypothetical protein